MHYFSFFSKIFSANVVDLKSTCLFDLFIDGRHFSLS